MNGYVAFYKGKRIEVQAPTSYDAQCEAAAIFRARLTRDVTVGLAKKDGEQVTHTPSE